jgi:CRP-like cAMP-binding protein
MKERVNPAQLARIALFNGLTESEITAVAQMMRTREFDTGAVIIHEGEIGGEMFVLLSGDIEITKRMTLYSSGGTDQKDKSLIRLKASDNIFFGEMSMFGQEERSATVTALTKVTLGVLTREQVNILSEKDPALGFHIFYNIGSKIASNLRRANKDILKLTTAFCLALEGK